MDAKQYYSEFKSTASYPGAHEGQFLYSAMAFVREFIEFQEAVENGDRDEILDEAGDPIWHMADCIDEINIKFGEPVIDFVEIMAVKPLAVGVLDIEFLEGWGSYLDACTKLWRDNNPIKLVPIKEAMMGVVSIIKAELENIGLDIETVLEYNRSKLNGRKANNTIHGR